MKRPAFLLVLTAAGSVVLAGLLAVGSHAGATSPGKVKPRPLCLGKRATIVGTVRANVIRGTRRNDVIVSLGGDDRIDGGGGNDRICGGPGADVVEAGAGRDQVDGGAGFDICRAAEGRRRCEESRRSPPEGPLPAGEYTTDPFTPRFSFRVGAGWSVDFIAPQVFELFQQPQTGRQGVLFIRFTPEESVAATVQRLSSLPNVVATAPVPTTIGNASGQRLELFALEQTTFGQVGAESFFLDSGDLARFDVVEARGRTVTIVTAAPGDAFEDFFTQADAVLATVRFS